MKLYKNLFSLFMLFMTIDMQGNVAMQSVDNKDTYKVLEKTMKQERDGQYLTISSSLPQTFAGESESVYFNFEDVDLQSVATYVERVHGVKFIAEDVVTTNTQAKGFAGHKISFRTNAPLTKQESWNLFLTFLNMAGLDVVPTAQMGFYKVVPVTTAAQESIPTYIGVTPDSLPDNDMIVRYVYFVKNIDPVKIQQLIAKMQSSSGSTLVYGELKSLIFTDKSYNIKSLMKIVKELDSATMPQVVSVIKLQRANVSDVIKLYQSLTPQNSGAQRAWAVTHKESTLEYFPQNVTLAGDERTNTLIVLGSKDAVTRIEKFITEYVDVELHRKTQPVYTYYLEYTNAVDMQKMLSSLVQYGNSTPAGKYGGVRDGYKFLQQMNIVADTHANALIINAVESDYRIVEQLIKALDIPQKQVALEILIVEVSNNFNKEFGSQLSGPNKDNTFLKNVSAQTSGIPSGSGVVVNQGSSGDTDYTIKTGLASLLTGSVVNTAGATLVTFGKPIWALFKMLQTITSATVVSNPFIVVTNNAKAKITSGSKRRVVTGAVVTSTDGKTVPSGYSDAEANLSIAITPQVNDENIIHLDIDIQKNKFANESSNDAVQDKKSITTLASLASGEVLVLGGITEENVSSGKSGVPILSDIPILGWLFKSKSKSVQRKTFVVFISPKILDDPKSNAEFQQYTDKKIKETQKYMLMQEKFDAADNKRDPFHRSFFKTDNVYEAKDLLQDGKYRAEEVYKPSDIAEKQDRNRSKSKRKVIKKQKNLNNNNEEQSKQADKTVLQGREKNRITNTVTDSVGAYYYD